MTDTPSENTSGTTAAGAAGQQTTLQQLATVVAAAVVQALAASGAQTVQQARNKAQPRLTRHPRLRKKFSRSWPAFRMI